MRYSLITLFIVVLSGCVSTKSMDILVDEKFEGPKIIAMSGTRAPWIYEIEKRLREKGFEIKRMASRNVSVEEVSPTKTEAYSCLLYTSPSPRDKRQSRMPSSA